MANTWKLPADLVTDLDTARARLDEEVAELRGRFDDASDRWRESEKGQGVEAWLDELTLVLDALDTVTAEPEG